MAALKLLYRNPENVSGGNLSAVAHKVIQKLFCYFDKERKKLQHCRDCILYLPLHLCL